jgi:hypothetical protein
MKSKKSKNKDEPIAFVPVPVVPANVKIGDTLTEIPEPPRIQIKHTVMSADGLKIESATFGDTLTHLHVDESLTGSKFTTRIALAERLESLADMIRNTEDDSFIGASEVFVLRRRR